MPQIISTDQSGRERLQAGVNALADAVKVTLGPKGRNVIIGGLGQPPHITKDGATVAQAIFLADPLANMAAQLVRDVAAKTASQAGDGTTTATVLTQAIFNAGAKNIASGANPMDMKRGVDAAVSAVVSHLAAAAVPVTAAGGIAQVGAVSANGDLAIGRMLAEALEQVGPNGLVTVQAGASAKTSVSVVAGIQFDRGYMSHHFITDESSATAVLENAHVLLINGKLANVNALVAVLQAVAPTKRPLLIICNDIDAEALSTLVVNWLRGSLRVVVVRSPGHGSTRHQQLQDIAVATGATLVEEGMGYQMENIELAEMGAASRVVVGKDSTVIAGGSGPVEALEERRRQLVEKLEGILPEDERALLRQRLAKLSGGVAVITVGGGSDVEINELKDRVDDALYATRAALEEGVVPGGGVALLRAASALDKLPFANEDERMGISMVRLALEAPLRAIVANAGGDPVSVVQKLQRTRNRNHGYNARTARYEDMVAVGVVDPVKVTRLAIENAASVAGLLLTTGAIICTTN